LAKGRESSLSATRFPEAEQRNRQVLIFDQTVAVISNLLKEGAKMNIRELEVI